MWSPTFLPSFLLLLQVAELATQMYITNDKPNVAGLVLSGSADFKTELSQSDMFDPRLQAVVLGVVDVSYGKHAAGTDILVQRWLGWGRLSIVAGGDHCF